MMKLKFALSLIALLAATDSHAAFQVTFKAGDASRTVVDGGAFDTNPDPGAISANSFILTDSTDANFSYTFQAISVDWSVIPGIDGDAYAINAAAQMNGASNAARGKTVSMFASVTDLTSIIGEPAVATANAAISLRTPYPGATSLKIADVTYGAYYDTTNTLATAPTGTSILAGTDELFGRSNPQPDAAAGFTDSLNAPDFSTNTFGMSVFYSVDVSNVGTFNNAPRFSFSGSSQLEQAPEPSHTALPVGIATGLLVMRRRRVMR
jgi:hypothetical protein